MSGIEVIGIIASVSQLLQYSARLILTLQDVCKGATKSSGRYHKHKVQVQQVEEIAKLIRNTEGLQSELIESHLISLTETTKSIEHAIESTLFFAGPSKKWKKCLRVLDIPKADATIFRGFDDLERDKSCLILCLLGNFGTLILDIQANVDQVPALNGKLEEIQRSLQDLPKVAEESRKIREEIEGPVKYHSCSACECQGAHMHAAVPLDVVKFGASIVQQQACRRESVTSEHGSSSSDTTLVGENTDLEDPGGHQAGNDDGDGGVSLTVREPREIDRENGRIYSRISAHDESSQLNGDFGWDPSERPRGRFAWVNICATGNSNQVNGNIRDAAMLTGFFSPRT